MSIQSSNKNAICFIHQNCVGYQNKVSVRKDVCKGLPGSYEYEGNNYCILHLPDETKSNSTDFLEIVNSKIQRGQNNFTYIFVPDAATFITKTFSSATFFDYATFHGQAEFSGMTFQHRVSFKNTNFVENATFFDVTFKNEVDFSSAKFNKEANFSSTKFKALADFSSVEFQGQTSFSNAGFSNHADFRLTKFLQRVSFSNAEFSDTSEFVKAEFLQGVSFDSAKFSIQVLFNESIFLQMVSFTSATFAGNVFFNFAKFEENSIVRFDQTLFLGTVSFQQTDINGFFYFEGGEKTTCPNGVVVNEGFTTCFPNEHSFLIWENARIKSPDKIFFHTVRLCPSWFIIIDSRKFIFTDCRWRNLDDSRLDTKSELQKLKGQKISNPNALLSKTCWQLADNYEENKGFVYASRFRLIANESKRLEEYKGFKVWRLHWWYWLSSFYGESWKRALAVLLAVLIIFAVGYMQSTFYVCPPDIPISQSSQNNLCETRKLNESEAIRHSLATATFQTVEYRKPITERSEIFVLLEKIFAPLQAALLALAIRRKFMR